MSQKGAADSEASSAEREFYTQLQAKLARAVRTSCPAWLRESTDDIVQSALVRVLAIAKKNAGVTGLGSSYLWKIAYSTLVDEIRKHARRREVDFAEQGSYLEFARPAFPDPETQASANEIGAALLDCLKTLLQSRRTAVTGYLHGHTAPETARLLGWTTKKTESLLYRGLSDLRKCLSSKGFRRD